MMDILEGRVLDVVGGAMIELAVDRVAAGDGGRYRSREWILLGQAVGAHEPSVIDDKMADSAPAAYDQRRVRCHVRSRDGQGRIVGDGEILDVPHPDEPYGIDGDGE
jgi:hypothetical protein